MRAEFMPDSVDFKPFTEYVDDQKAYGSCVAHAGQTALEIAFSRAGKPADLSRMYLYYYVQKLAGTLGTVDGGYPKDLGYILENYGVCSETTWPYDKSQLSVPPSQTAFAEAALFVPPGTVGYTKLYGVEEIKRAICKGMPVVFGMAVHTSFNILGPNWKLHTWDTNVPVVGGHAVCCIGYDDASQRFLCENSWSSKWGDGGFFGIPYGFVQPSLVVYEAYTFDKLPVPITPIPEYQEESIPWFDLVNNILDIPSIYLYPGNYAQPTKHKLVRLQVVNPGIIKMNDEVATKVRASFFAKNGDFTQWQLLLPRVESTEGMAVGLVQTGATYRLISFE
jgi:hypothetical protein